jgi:methyl-accepting chemotaxis protein
MNPKSDLRSLYRSFLLKHIFYTDGLGYIFVIPIIAAIYVMTTPLGAEQVNGFILTAFIVSSVYIPPIILTYWYMHRPFALFVRKISKNEVVDDSLKIAVRERFSSFSTLHSLSITVRWLTGFFLLSVLVNFISGISFEQLLNLWIAASVVTAYSYIEYYYVSKKLVKNFSNNAAFHDLNSVVSNKKTTFMGSLIDQIATGSTLILIVLTLILTVTAIAVAQYSLSQMYHEMTASSSGAQGIMPVEYIKSLAVWMTGMGGFWLVVAMVIIYKNTKESLNPVTVFSDKIVSFAQGDFSGVPDFYIGGNEIGMLGSSTKILSDRINDVVRVISSLSNELAAASEEMSSSSMNFSESTQTEAANIEQISASMEQMSSNISNVANNTEDVFSNLMQLIDSMQVLSEYITGMSMSVGETLLVVQTIANDAKSGRKTIMNMNDTMNIITKSSEDMAKIVGIINDISERINLLSLNASIEAARAGDAGRGFAVVAGEISKLADQTARSIKEITSLITIANNEIYKSTHELMGTSETLQRIIKGVNDIEICFDKINAAVGSQLQTNTRVHENVNTLKMKSEGIKIAAGEQKSAVMEISKSMNNINESTNIYAAGVEEMAGTSETVAQMAATLKQTIEFFRV